MTRPQRLIVLVTVFVLAVFGGLWWTKTIAFTRTALVEFSVTPTQPDAGTTSYVFVGIQTTPPRTSPRPLNSSHTHAAARQQTTNPI